MKLTEKQFEKFRNSKTILIEEKDGYYIVKRIFRKRLKHLLKGIIGVVGLIPYLVVIMVSFILGGLYAFIIEAAIGIYDVIKDYYERYIEDRFNECRTHKVEIVDKSELVVDTKFVDRGDEKSERSN